jgi:hypothetical protein
MTITDVPRYREAFARLCAAFGKRVDPLQQDAWWDVMEGLPIDTLEAGMLDVARASTDRYFPRAADVYAIACKRVREQARPTRSIWVNPETGLRERVFACGRCFDTGWERRALSTEGRPELTPEVAATYTAVRRCACKTSRNEQEVA